MISLQAVCVGFPAAESTASIEVLRGVDLQIKRGTWLALVAGNGGGKSTLLRILAGALAPSSGGVTFIPRRPDRISYVAQQPDDYFVTDQVRSELENSFPLRPAGEAADPEECRARRIDEVVERFALWAVLDRNPHTLSGGEKQRLVLASVVLARPTLLLLDEPETFLDAGMRESLFAVVGRLHDEGTTVVWASPGGDSVARSREVALLRDGRVVRSVSPREFVEWCCENATDLRLPRALELARAICSGTPPGAGACGVWPPDIDGVARSLAHLCKANSPRRAPGRRDAIPNGPPAGGAGLRRDFPAEETPKTQAGPDRGEGSVALKGVRFAWPAGFVLGPVDLCISPGECVGLAGASASGKTTLLRLLSGLETPYAGTVQRGGIGRRVYFLPQHPWTLFFCETVREEITWGMRQPSAESAAAVAGDALRASGLDERIADRFPMVLSGGEKRRVAFSIAHRVAPSLLVLDEPGASLDTAGVEALNTLVSRERVRGAAICIASHDTDFLCKVCDRVVTLDRGRVVGDFDTSASELDARVNWPVSTQPQILALQRKLDEYGVSVSPRALVPRQLGRRLLLENHPE